jgi:hypothetical protein
MWTRPNLRLVTDQVLLLQLEKRRLLAEIDKRKGVDNTHPEQMLGWMLVGVLATGCLLIAWYR